MVVVYGLSVVAKVDPAYPPAFAAEPGPNADGHRVDRARAAGGIAGLAVAPPRLVLFGAKGSGLTQPDLGARPPTLPERRDGARQSQNATAAV